MNQLKFPRIGEAMEHEILENGLNVFVSKKPGFQKSYAFFATQYGGMDTRFDLGDGWIDTPEGVAHYLEHKMFDTEDGNALQDLASNGASPNAFTSNAITGYYFECTEKFDQNLKTLLSFVSIPWFTQQSVDKEQGIIGQEIGMYDDDPNWRVYMGLVESLYQNHPVRTSIAGTVESISHITAETLYACHKAFYDPANMVLCVAGDVDPEHVCAIAREILPKQAGSIAKRDYGPEEPNAVKTARTERKMAVSTPLFQIGFKGDAEKTGDGLRQQLLGELTCEVLMGNSSPLYARLYKEGLINQGFGYGYEHEPGCAFLIAGGESKDPDAVRDAILKEAQRIAKEDIDAALWTRIKKGCYGNRVRALNSFEHVCIGQAQDFFRGCNTLSFPEAFDSIQMSDARNMIASWCTAERCALSVVAPVKEA